MALFFSSFFFELCVQCFVDLFCLVCVLYILAILFRELLFFFSPPRGYCFPYALCLWCASVMVVAQHHHMQLLFPCCWLTRKIRDEAPSAYAEDVRVLIFNRGRRPMSPFAPEKSNLIAGSDYPDHRKCLTQPQYVISA